MGEKEKKKAGRLGKKKSLILMAVIIVSFAAVLFAMELLRGDRSIEFETLHKNKIPQEISSQVIPEYRTLERALACTVENKVYVVVTRGEKPTSGFQVSIDRMIMEEEKGKQNLVVYADFEDPDEKTSLSQIMTYPVQVAVTDLERLPDEIELRIQYE